jgi:tripeptide aminopeptidase
MVLSLSADDKAGIAEIVTAAEYLIANPEIKHGRISIGFTPDEEIGRGADKFNVAHFNAEWAYTWMVERSENWSMKILMLPEQ